MSLIDSSPKMIRIEDITEIPELRLREVDEDHVQSIVVAIQNGEKLKPIKLFHITDRPNARNVLVSGWHRRQARINLGQEVINAFTREGTFQEALEVAVKENRDHGLPFSKEDKAKIVDKMLILDSKRSNRSIGRTVGVSDTMVGSHRKKLEAEGKIQKNLNVVGSDDKEYPSTPIGNDKEVNLRMLVYFASQGQRATVYKALQRAGKEAKSDKICHLLEMICVDYLAGLPDEEDKAMGILK